MPENKGKKGHKCYAIYLSSELQIYVTEISEKKLFSLFCFWNPYLYL